MTAPKLTNIRKLAPKDQEVKTTLESYVSHFEATTEGRKSKYKQIANDYYDLATHFYEFGSVASFHFAPRYNGENLAASLARYEYSLAHRLGLQTGHEGLGYRMRHRGPEMRAIARFSSSHILGINNNAYQIQRGQKLNGNAGLSELCDFLKTDFMQMPLPDQSVDAIYTIDAICYAPDKKKLGTELLRVMKDGSYITGNDSCSPIVTIRIIPNIAASRKGSKLGADSEILDSPLIPSRRFEVRDWKLSKATTWRSIQIRKPPGIFLLLK